MSNAWKLGRMYSPSPTEATTPHDIIWAAGIYEGEGTCNYNAGSERASVSQKGRWLVDRLQSLFGGSVTQQGQSHKDMWAWVVYGARARGFLQSIYGMLSPRRQYEVLGSLGIEMD